jgi:hypothetical protein
MTVSFLFSIGTWIDVGLGKPDLVSIAFVGITEIEKEMLLKPPSL